MRFRELTCVAVTVSSVFGCAASHGSDNKQNDAVSVISDARTLRDQRQHFLRIMAGSNRARDCSRLLDKWGRINQHYDVAIVDLLRMGSDHSVCAMDETTGPLWVKRLREDPSLLRQVFWYERWSARNQMNAIGLDSETGWDAFLSNYQKYVFSQQWEGWKKLAWIVRIASMLNQPELVVDVDKDNLEIRWRELKTHLRDNANYYYFDPKEGTFILDKEAMDKRIPTARNQNWTTPRHCLPAREYRKG
jgi:hypothetical protein